MSLFNHLFNMSDQFLMLLFLLLMHHEEMGSVSLRTFDELKLE